MTTGTSLARSRRVRAVVFSLVVFTACCSFQKSREPSNTQTAGPAAHPQPGIPLFAPPVERGWKLIQVTSGNVDDDAEAEYVVITQKAHEDESLEGNTRVRIFEYVYDTNAWEPTEIEGEFDLFCSGTEATFTDVDNDGRSEVVISAWTCSGNDATACLGLIILAKRGRYYRQLFNSSNGAPSLEDLDGDKVKEVVIHGEYWGPLSHADVIFHPTDVFKYDNQTYRRAPNSQFPAYFDAKLKEAMAEYERAKSSVGPTRVTEQEANRLFRPLMVMLISFKTKGDLAGMKQRYLSEHEFLKAMLPKSHLEAVEEFVSAGRH